jgi:hypothetical protein
MGYPKDPEEDRDSTTSAEVSCCETFRKTFEHEPTWDRNKWSKDWGFEYDTLCDLEECGLLYWLRPVKPSSLTGRQPGERLFFCDNTGITGDRFEDYGKTLGDASYRSFCLRVYVVGLELAFMHEFGHPPTTDMNLWSNNRAAERRAYWVVTGRPHDDPATSRPPFLSNWEDDLNPCESLEDRRAISMAHMQEPDLAGL